MPEITMKRKLAFLIILSISMGMTVAPQGGCFSIQGPVKTLETPAYRIRGTEYLPLTLVCDAYGIDWKWDSSSMTVHLKKNDSEMRLRVDDYRVYANNTVNIQEKPVIMYRGAVCIPVEFLRAVFNNLFLGPVAPPRPAVVSHCRIKKIVLDAGHGGYDPGAIGRDGIKEKYITLDITRKISALLEEEGIAVVMTRDDDTFIPLWRRTEIANRSRADLFVSIHANASVARRLKGFEVYYLSEELDDNARASAIAKERAMKFRDDSVYRYTDVLNEILWDLELTENRRSSIELGNRVLDNIDTSKRAIKSARFFVLKGSEMPAVLVEVGYISNRDECSRLGSGEYRTDIAERVARGILDYKRKFEETDGFCN
jgi:N-acetylmuramoyl-L-alanine amidase